MIENFSSPTQTVCRFPVPRRPVQMLASAVATTVNATLQTGSASEDAELEHCFVSPEARLLIAGSACALPLLLSEARHAGRLTGFDVVIVRLADDGNVSFDIVRPSWRDELLGYRLWLSEAASSAWLIPGAAGVVSLQLAASGLVAAGEAPYPNSVDRWFGLQRGAQYLSFATRDRF